MERNGQSEAREEFVARRLGHDMARTRYEVDRTPAHQAEPPGADLSAAAKEPARGVGL